MNQKINRLLELMEYIYSQSSGLILDNSKTTISNNAGLYFYGYADGFIETCMCNEFEIDIGDNNALYEYKSIMFETFFGKDIFKIYEEKNGEFLPNSLTKKNEEFRKGLKDGADDAFYLGTEKRTPFKLKDFLK